MQTRYKEVATFSGSLCCALLMILFVYLVCPFVFFYRFSPPFFGCSHLSLVFLTLARVYPRCISEMISPLAIPGEQRGLVKFTETETFP